MEDDSSGQALFYVSEYLRQLDTFWALSGNDIAADEPCSLPLILPLKGGVQYSRRLGASTKS